MDKQGNIIHSWKKAALFCYVLVRAIDNVAAATEIKKICTALCTVQYGLLVQVRA